MERVKITRLHSKIDVLTLSGDFHSWKMRHGYLQTVTNIAYFDMDARLESC
jgi:hypothetical protein